MDAIMNDRRDEEQDRRGLCASCRHAYVFASDRGATFVRCELSKVDPCFPRFPALPVVTCSGYDRADSK
jgi:hypothetical protein